MGGPTQITDGERTVKIDRVTNTLQTIDYGHHEIHGGSSYRCGAVADVGSGNTLTLSFKTANSAKHAHMVWSVSTENSANVTVYEESEVTGGSAKIPKNANRNHADASTMQSVVQDATVVTTNATPLGNRHIGAAGVKPNDPSFGGGAASRHEWVLKSNTWYTIKLEETATVTQSMWIGLDWYEHTAKTS